MADMLTIGPAAIPQGSLEELISVVPEQPLSADAEKAPSPSSPWVPQKLNARHREIMRRLLEGATYKAIAEQMGISAQSIMLVANSPLFKAELEKLEQAADFQVMRRAEQLSNEALDTLKLIMRHGRSELARKNAADSILDRAGYGKIEKKIVGVVNGEDVIKELNRQRQERMRDGASGPGDRQKFVTEDVTAE